jgi:hypothetical protein
MKRGNLAFVAAAILSLALVGNAQAGLTRVVPNVWTTNYTDPALQEFNIWISVYDFHNSRGPDFVRSITVTAPDPDGSVFTLHASKDWLQYDRGYWKRLYAADFRTRTIPSGTYRITVTPIEGSAITESDTITVSFLPTPVVTSPALGASDVVERPVIRWMAVPGATFYRVLLWNNSWNEPVYWYWDKQAHTDFTTFQIPRGELKPNCDYRFRIEARADGLDLERRSRSDWFSFRTGNW